MKNLTTYVEQLDRGAEELHAGTDVGNRLALILVDNVIELLLHRYCESRFGWAGKLEFPEAPQRYTRAAKARVLGQRFDEKLKFVKAENRLSEVEFGFIGVCHKYRNEAYHIGVSRENVLFPIAWLYHQLACDIFVRLDTRTRSHGARIEVPERVAKHAPASWQQGRAYINLFDTAPIAESLNRARPDLANPSALYADALEEWVAHLVDVTDYAVGGMGKSEETVLIEAQWWKDLFSDIPPDVEEGEPFGAYLRQKRAAMEQSWKPRYRSVPFDAWRKRTARLRQVKDGRAALLTYDRLYDEIAYFDGFILDAAGWVDQRAEEALERYRAERHRAGT
ncbi:hypothetical protein [Burkholderia cepacia]|uniref:hypothetical protein n=1 Tax=Burkholderia cepacia TaxID=292 RepID=UPI000759C1FB|nr:hypothetical protein [Burkholderia cepacia]KWF99081.1 hypothetical protein WL95_00255 [Burkholderia cepacia]